MCFFEPSDDILQRCRDKEILLLQSQLLPLKNTLKSKGGRLHLLNFVRLQLNILNFYVLSPQICNIDPTTKRQTHMLLM